MDKIAFAAVGLKNFVIFKFSVRVRFPYVCSVRTISVRFKRAFDFRPFLMRVRFPSVFNARSISVRLLCAYDFRPF